MAVLADRTIGIDAYRSVVVTTDRCRYEWVTFESVGDIIRGFEPSNKGGEDRVDLDRRDLLHGCGSRGRAMRHIRGENVLINDVGGVEWLQPGAMLVAIVDRTIHYETGPKAERPPAAPSGRPDDSMLSMALRYGSALRRD
jgi:hypothetical protein